MADAIIGGIGAEGNRPSSSDFTEHVPWIVLAVMAGLGFAFLDARGIIAVAVCVTLTLLTLERPIVAVAVLIASVPLQDAFTAQLGGFSSTWTRVIFAILVVTWLVRLALNRERVQMTALSWVFALFCGVLAISIFNTHDIGAWAGEVYRWCVALIVLIIVSSLRLGKREIDWILVGLGAGVILCFVVSLNQVLTTDGPSTFQQRGLIRAFGYFGEPNPLAGYLEMAVLPLVAIGFSRLGHRSNRKQLQTVALLAIGAAGAVALLLTQSRGGLLGFSAGIAVIAWVLFPVWGRRVVFAGGLTAAVLIWFPQATEIRRALGIESLIKDGPVLVTPENWATEERIAHWGAAIRMWDREPWLGIGAGNYPERFREFTPTWRFRISRGHAHSAYLQAAAQAGAAGLGAYLLLMSLAVNRSIRDVRIRSARIDRGIAAGVLAVTAAIAVHGLFDYLHVLSLGILLSVIWSMNVATEVTSVGEAVNHGGD